MFNCLASYKIASAIYYLISYFYILSRYKKEKLFIIIMYYNVNTK